MWTRTRVGPEASHEPTRDSGHQPEGHARPKISAIDVNRSHGGRCRDRGSPQATKPQHKPDYKSKCETIHEPEQEHLACPHCGPGNKANSERAADPDPERDQEPHHEPNPEDPADFSHMWQAGSKRARPVSEPSPHFRCDAGSAAHHNRGHGHGDGSMHVPCHQADNVQALALAAVAKALVTRGDTRRAHHVASAACAVGQWTTVLELVLSLEPSALRMLTDL